MIVIIAAMDTFQVRSLGLSFAALSRTFSRTS